MEPIAAGSPPDADGGAPERYDLGLCLSGGGYRAMLFHAGAICRLNEAGLLQKLDMVSSVSGGSIAAGLLAVLWPRFAFVNGVAANFDIYLNRILEFSQVFLDAPAIFKGLLNPLSSAAREVAACYERHLFDGSRPMLKSLPEKPWFVFCSSNLGTGSLFRLSRRYIADYRIGVAYQADLPVALAVAASSAFPPFLSPLRLDLTPFAWKNDKLDPSVGPPVPPSRAVLTDGGVYDNHGIEPALKRCRWLLVSDAGAPWQASSAGYRNWFSQLKRVLDTTDNQVRSLRRRDLVARFQAAKDADDRGLANDATRPGYAATRGVFWSIASKPDTAEPTFVQTAATAPADIGTSLHFLGSEETVDLVNWGYCAADQALRGWYEPAVAAGKGVPLKAGDVKPGRCAVVSKTLMSMFKV
ncbi:patatin-like phospholipase family protein [Mesorhizobium sp. CA15]|uniref:patatin-like phospholipase family protein n=1 Tax=unclassified Mesorhizobium TaxID=325217 RepID=UPI001CC9A98F|nr:MULTISPECIES: patatin-like phospholipase family protein [unclassified Mesorhizobium]MBZ9736932.1 patatin-like phospholipase family protein [Mesorhizobium sp. CA9]MBZ9827303.1 patatin-like phospholipase family protein [Mesorhizobium sp. CA18]MBZ9832672.1 patatin-like phospholipase family protein [Mesorhizobium sp. CA2]MBZ9838949.1 patatin-like phospholipase family protein [Mesorhizobium sp. CA3]MBZ9868481.1 patatin-like phospholipase family protein [Mesorhizobium sp. CA15]